MSRAMLEPKIHRATATRAAPHRGFAVFAPDRTGVEVAGADAVVSPGSRG